MSISGPLQPQTALYRAVWRWHFLAGLFALPFLLNMAITGGLYLFAPEINHILYRSLEDVPVRADVPLPASVLVQKAAESAQGEVMGLTLPAGPDRSVEMLIRTGEGESRTAYVDPYDGRLLGTIPIGGINTDRAKNPQPAIFRLLGELPRRDRGRLGHRSRPFGNFSLVAARP